MSDVVMPQMGESIVEGTLTRWLKKKGESVERDEPLFEISTDKVDTEIPSPAAGVLSEILVEEGQTVEINTVVARISAGGAAPAPEEAKAEKKEEAPAPEPEKEEVKAEAAPPPPAKEEEPEPAAAEASVEGAGPLSPLVRRMAREHNVDLGQVKGTGAGGRITKQDIEGYLASRSAAPPAAPAPAKKAAPAPAPAPSAPPRVDPAKIRVEPMSTMRQKIAEHMILSKQTSAHVTTVHKVDMTKVARLRQKNKADFQARYGMSLTFLPFFARAAVEALREFPIVNSSIEGTNILYHNEINIGIAVALENGLIVPVIRHADEKNVVGLQRSIVDLAARARSRQLKPDEVQGGTFSITNFGSFGSVFATPVINQPQVAILGVGTVEKVPVVTEDDAIAIRSVCYLCLTFDHRLIDGALADQFVGKAKSVLENWSDEVL
ncbi:MAG: 2-oxoglutarate dehydrogenase, E2 component, dihydrolipoamide succinyltransferase [Bryobacterales bacterium]|nr:2-oxoglutarate dehydrogenase, E2 component, dihydrolipoamide succinyltransferase [Bryobacterales bacterium]